MSHWINRVDCEDSIETLSELPVNSQVHINHINCEAGTDTKMRLYLKRVFGGVLAYCHHCGGKNFFPIREVCAHFATATTVMDDGDKKMEEYFKILNYLAPVDVKNNIDVLLYVSQFGLQDSPFLAASRQGYLLFIHPAGVTVSRCPSPKAYNVYKARADAVPLLDGSACRKDILVLTEDALSALKVYEAGHTAIPLLGTNLTDPVKQLLVNDYGNREVLIHLDDDYPGMLASLEIQRELRGLGVNSEYVMSTEPKYQSIRDLQLLYL